MQEKRLKIAIQKSGRLSEKSLELLEKCGIQLEKSKNQLLCSASNFPLDILFVRDDDIPAFVATDVCHLGIVGENVLLEKQCAMPDTRLETTLKLGFGQCRLSLAVPNEVNYTGLNYFRQRKIATSYKALLKEYLQNQCIDATVVTMQGAVEIAPQTHLADGICDLVSTGSTLTSNGLKEVEILFKSQAVLIENTTTVQTTKTIYQRLLKRIKAVLRSTNSRYVMLHCPTANLEAIQAIFPGSETPTVLPLQGEHDKVAVHAVCDEGVFWETMEDLKARGASSILVLPIEKMLD